jgi:DNA-binding IclR family transcriptional regulator
MSRSRKEGEGETVQAVTRALSLLELLSGEADPITITELSRKACLKLTTTHRLLSTLLSRGFVSQDPASFKYRLGLKSFEIGVAAMASMDLTATAKPFLKTLAAETTETTNLAILDGSEVVYIDQLESTNMVIVKMFARIGSRGPAYCTGTGKVLLADLPEDELRRRLAGVNFIKFTERTITDINELVAILKQIRITGYALDYSERDEGVTCVAAPIKNHENRVQAAISVSGPIHRMTDERIFGEILPSVLKAAHCISESLGYRGVSISV